ncbi:MAG TPA: hypothetical protein VL985_16235 [Stellaceae bacterium]|nr:hypothetical protein [Stellaceae bacterium]
MRQFPGIADALIALSLALGMPLATAAEAQTTTFSSDCNPNISISPDGLTLTSAHTNPYWGYGCRADTAKYSGAWYFEVTQSAGMVGAVQGVGVANNGRSQRFTPGWSTTPTNFMGGDQFDAGLQYGSSTPSTVFWNNTPTRGLGAVTAGKTIGIALNLETDPPQIWVTPDVTGTTGYRGGPMWNGSAASSPTLPGSGAPTAGGTGKPIFIRGYGYFPVYQFVSNAGPEAVTFDFGASPFRGPLPPGYRAWNAGGGSIPVPGPSQPLTINVANAPGWQPDTAYAIGDRVVAGAGWTPGKPGAFTSGQPIYLWAAISGGTSAATGDGPRRCPSPARTGGISTGHWSGATTALDGTVGWVCLTKVDYVTLTGALIDAPPWAPYSPYYSYQWVTNAGNSYRMLTDEHAAPYTCTSGASGPIGDDGTCSWGYQGTVTYSSLNNRWPHQLSVKGPNAEPEMQFNYDVDILLWYGGAKRPSYQPGQEGEANPITMWFHDDFLGEMGTACYHAYGLLDNNNNCAVWFDLKAAPGDSFADNARPGTTPLRADPTKGVAILSKAPWVPGGPGDAIGLSDSFGTLENLQLLSINGPVIDTYSGPGNHHCNAITVRRSILDAGGGKGVVELDGVPNINNDVLIYRGSFAGGFAVYSNYAGNVYNNTAIATDCTNCTFLEDTNPITFSPKPPVRHNNAFFGFANPWAIESATWPATDEANNATDIAASYTGGVKFTSPTNGRILTTQPMPGIGSTCAPSGNTSSCHGLVAAHQFVDAAIGPSLDLRIKPTADIYGAGGNFWRNGMSPGNDIYGTARPQAGRYDIGAMELPGGRGGLGGGR